MARFNTKSSNKTVNMAGGEAYKESTELEIVSILLTSFVTDKFYESANETIDRIKTLVTPKNAQFVAKASLYARKEFGMRSITHVVAGEIANKVKGANWTKKYFETIVYRPDDATEILSYYMTTYGKPIPNSLKKGLGKALSKFKENTLAKYRGEGKALSMIDVVNLIHPKSSSALDKLMTGKLILTDTWESDLTKAGQEAKSEDEKDEMKKEVWTKLIKERQIGHFALLRNLRNIIEQNPEIVDEALAMLVDESQIKKSLVLPFRYLTAIEQIKQLNGTEARKTLVALNKAVDISLSNVPELSGDTLVVLDTSASMDGKPAEIGALFSAILVKKSNADFMTFSNDANYQTLNPMDSTLTIAKSIRFASGGTNFHSIFETANRVYDRVIILSDMQGWIGYDTPVKEFNEYKQRLGANPKIYSFDLNGHGTLQFPENNVYALAGFSEKIFDIMKLLEEDKKALVHKIESIEL